MNIETNKKIFSVYCPKCNAQTRISTRNKERLKEMKTECAKCDWQDYAGNGIIKEESFGDWFAFEDGRERGEIKVSTDLWNREDRREFEKNFKKSFKEES